MNQLLAQIQIAPSGGFHGIGPLGNPQGTGILNLSNFISVVIGVMTIVAFIWFTFILVTGAISIIGSGGDKQALETARKKITNGIIGLILVISAVFIIDIIGTIFGIKFLNLFQLFYNITGLSQPNGTLPPGIT
jgi:hypothetical protein